MYQPKYVKRIIYSEQEILNRINDAANWINLKYKDYKDKPVVICILKGAVQFYSHLLKRIERDVLLDFTTMNTYRGMEQDIKNLDKVFITNLAYSLQDKNVIVVEDIADSANTLSILLDNIKAQKPKSIATVILVDKPDCRKKGFVPDFACFTMQGSPWIIGFGMDCNELGRTLPYIAEYNQDYINEE